MNTVKILVCFAATFVVFAILAAPATAFYVSYNYYCYATNSDGIPIGDEDTLTGEIYVDGDYTKTGAHGNYGTAAFCADLHTATISVHAHSHGLQTGPFTFPSGTGRVERCSFQDRLYFTVPAGYYPDGVQAGVYGVVVGSLGSDVGAGALARCMVSLGSDNYDTSLLEVGVDESGTITVNESFVLVAQLVMPGTTLTEAREYDELITVGFYNGRTWSTSFNPGGGSVIGDGDIIFPDGLRLTALKIPTGVTWTSESGAFPQLPTAVHDDLASAHRPRLRQNHPNPFNPVTMIRYALPEPCLVTLHVYDVSGRLVRDLRSAVHEDAGQHEAVWRGLDEFGRPAASGTYFYCLTAGPYTETKRMILLK